MTSAFQIALDGDFPIDDLAEISQRLALTGGVTPGFIPPSVGALDLGALFYARHQGWTPVVLPDRNLVSRMARIARDGALIKRDKPTQFACDLMALCQGMDMLLEPSIACHELAACDGNVAAQVELGWFRAADKGGFAQAWIDLAMGRLATVHLGDPESPKLADLAFPLRRWNRNYIVCLKIAELELGSGPLLAKAMELLRWMYEDFQIAGPAAILALFYIAPANKHRGLIRKLRAGDRTEAIAGVKNAAWDATHLSDFVARAGQGETEQRRYYFATADESLAALAPVLFSGLQPSDEGRMLSDFLATVWPTSDAEVLMSALAGYIARHDSPERPQPAFGPDFLEAAIKAGEQRLLDWVPG